MKFLLSLLLLTSFCFSHGEEIPSLQSEIDAKKEENRAKASPEKLKAYGEGIEAVKEAETVSSAVGRGDEAIDFTLPNSKGETVTLSEELKKGPVVLTWYRGGWCPYCNIQLAAYQEILPQIEELGAQLIAVSPELPDKSLSTIEKSNLRFTVLSDQNLKVAKQYGLVFQLTPAVEKLYGEFFDMNEFNGADAAANELPLAATYVISREGKVVYAFLEEDYTLRAEPRDIVDALDKLD